MSSIVVLWYSTESLLSGLIRWVTRSTFSHVAIMLDGVLYEALGSGIRKLEGKAATKRASEAVAHKYLPAHRTDVEQITEWLEEQVGNGYSILGFIMAGIQTVTGHSLVISLPGEYICSGIVARALQLAGYLSGIEPRLATPASLAVIFEPNDLPWTDPHLPERSVLENEAVRRTIRIGAVGEEVE